ncbi:methyltransferase [Lacihabitans sp. LS3-19]|uniref:HsdM family class I SAM-dependent methyltransferase n=1 Tax=Lacihabitans sp. LS3-19 TaxID=2487335 RepID=UPI0020CDD9B1|nr:N-6 DNA methylase [Lacihabitans sp. LS3-19]MCP9770463.1 methyltransferase [Lacihabitans sp. LS3-19]
MINERKTENIVRSHFQQFSKIYIEEQRSENIKIQKLLKNASKKGIKNGLPEFIIQFEEDNNLLIVIECKGDVSKHESKLRDQYGSFAVDDVLLYASFLSKEYDVIAIAVSGVDNNNLRISHFLHLKGESKAIQKFSDELLTPESYLKEYLTSPEKFRQDYNSLLSFSKELNETLHAKKIKESQRSLLISGVLIALENRAFEVSYKQHTKPEDLANILADTISNQLKNANLHSKKIENLKNAYNFIRTHTALSGENTVLSDIIESIDKNINKFIKTHKYFDVLGQFYIEFLRYANSDKGLGIVLTPPHITELFVALAGVNKDSIVYDNCTGTGGFLISSMNEMVHDAKGNIEKIKLIKEKQLIGVEWQDDIFALACSNMFIHQDGKTNIIHGDCFDASVIAIAKEQMPNVGFLNPPYKTKKTDTEELEFVLNNLEALQPSGTCIAIVPMQCVIATSGLRLSLKQKLLDRHTLEAVFSMPDELFFNSDVGVITAVIVATAHRPHPFRKKTFFGYWKDDGFTKRKNKGRIDAVNKWERIRSEWLDTYINRIDHPGKSINKVIKAEDEWCAEAFMETDYKKLNKDNFIEDIKKYLLFEQLYGHNG